MANVLSLSSCQQSGINIIIILSEIHIIVIIHKKISKYIYLKLIFHHKYLVVPMVFQWQLLPLAIYDYIKWFCLLCLWAWIFKDIGAIEVLQLLLLLKKYHLFSIHMKNDCWRYVHSYNYDNIQNMASWLHPAKMWGIRISDPN